MPSIPGGLRQRWAGRVRRTISKRDISRKQGLPRATIPRQPSAADIGTTAKRSARSEKSKTRSFKTNSPRPSLKGGACCSFDAVKNYYAAREDRQLSPGGLRFFSTSASVIIIIIG